METSCFYDLGLSRPGIEPRSPACEAKALPLRHHGGTYYEGITKIETYSQREREREREKKDSKFLKIFSAKFVLV